MSRFKGIAEFIAVVEAGSFSRAAENLEMAVSQVSKRVTELELRLGIALLHRTTRQIRVSEAGEAYYRACKNSLDLLDAAEESLAGDARIKGRIKLCTVGGSRPAFMIHILADFLQKNPDVQLELQFENRLPNLLERNIDLAFLVGEAEGIGDRSVRLAWVDYALVASPAFMAIHGEIQTPEALVHMPCIINDSEHWRLGNGDKTVMMRVTGIWQCADMPACIDACISGVGVFMAPEYNLDSLLQEGKLVHVLKGWTIRKPIYAVLPKTHTVSSKVIQLMQHLEECLGTNTEQRQELLAMLRKPNAEHIAMLESINQTLKKETLGDFRKR